MNIKWQKSTTNIWTCKEIRQSENRENITEHMNLSDFEEEIEMPNEDVPAQEYCKLLLKEYAKLRKDIKSVRKEQQEQFKNNLDTALLVANMSDCIVQLEMEIKCWKKTKSLQMRKSSDWNINKELIICCMMALMKSKVNWYGFLQQDEKGNSYIYKKQNPNVSNKSGDPYELAGRIVVIESIKMVNSKEGKKEL